MKRRGVTLIELIMSSTLVAVIILATFALDTTARRFFVSSDRKSTVLNEITFVTDTIQKRMSQAHGWSGDPGFLVIGTTGLLVRVDVKNITYPIPTLTPHDTGDDFTYFYYSNGQNLEMCRTSTTGDMTATSSLDCDGVEDEVLTTRLSSWSVSTYTLANGATAGVTLTITGVFDPSNPVSERSNPDVTFTTTITSPQSSIN